MTPCVVKFGLRLRAFVVTLMPAVVTLFCGESTDAQEPATDRVTLQLENNSSRIIVRCRIRDYTSRSITVRTKAGESVRTYPASEVVDVETPQTESHLRGLARFAEGRIEEAVPAFQRALSLETRAWVRREILAMLIRCALKQGKTVSAGTRFLAMLENHPHARHFHLIPLDWTPTGDGPSIRANGESRPSKSTNLTNTARQWMSQSEPAARLLGASHLLQHESSGRRARSQLDELAASPHRRIRHLAQAQHWRLRVHARTLSGEELVHWENQIESMQDHLRGGPYYLLGQAYKHRKEYDRAAAAFLWLPLVYDHDPYLAARAELQAADALKRIGQDVEAQTLYGEVVRRFRETPSAAQAASRLRGSGSREKQGTEPPHFPMDP